MAHGVVPAEAKANQHAQKNQLLRRGDKELEKRGQRDQQKAEGKNTLTSCVIGDPAQNQAAKKQAKQRRAADQAFLHGGEIHLRLERNNGVANDAEHITVGQVRTKGESGNTPVKAG
ncbi:hypothetical protein D3C76_1243020 [compost metagenome]